MLNITIYMAISLNGFIAGTNNETPWSDDEWENYKNFLSKNDCLIIGRKTYELMLGADEFETLNNPNYIVVTHNSIPNILTANTPEQALSIASKKNWTNIVVGGGQTLNTYFLNNSMANSLHLDIEPIILNDGLALFEKSISSRNLSFIQSVNLPSGTISADYKIKDSYA